METQRLSWIAVRNGDIYCSPACGARCTYKKYEKAVNDAENLVKICTETIGGIWETRVHENLGWHWSVIQKGTGIDISYGGYLATGDYYSVGLGGGTPAPISLHPKTFKSPKEAYDCQIEAIKKERNRWDNILNNA